MDARERKGALAAGLGLLLMTVLAPYATFGILGRAGEASTGQLSLATGMMGVVAVLDVVVAWGLWVLFRADAPRTSAAAAWVRVAYAALLALAVFRLGTAGGGGAARAQAFHQVFEPALGLFGVHLVLLAWPVGWTRHARDGFRTALAVLVALAGAGYVVDAILPWVVGPVTVHLASFTFFGELLLMVWLFVVAVRGAPAA